MKKIALFSFVLFATATFSFGQTKPTMEPHPAPSAVAPAQSVEPAVEAPAVPTKAKMIFADGNYDTNCDYGTIENNGEPLRIVKFKNEGTEPLIIKNAKGSCGCTVPVWPKEPILPGQESQIEIRYATNRTGKIDKRVTITTNEEKTHTIRVIGEVLPEKKVDSGIPTVEPSVIKG